jgi:chromosome segregation ATPase
MKRFDLDRMDLKEKLNVYENTVFRTNKKIEEIKAKMKWDQQTLESWLEESAHRDDDAMILAKYSRVDEDKIKALSLRLEQLQESAVRKSRLLDTESTETVAAQIELDKTAMEFRKAHVEREELIQQWEHTIDQMKRRDADMDRCAAVSPVPIYRLWHNLLSAIFQELDQLRAEIRTKNDAIREKQEFLDGEKRNNEEKEKSLGVMERKVAKARLTYQESESARLAFKNELETLKYSVDRAGSDLEKARYESSHLTRQIKDSHRKLETVQRQRELMQEELKRSTQKVLSAEERAQEIDSRLTEEDEHLQQLEKDIAKMREKQFKAAQEMFELKGKEMNMLADIQGGRATLRNLGSKQNKLDEETLKQQEILYTQDLQLQQLQRKMSRLDGERTDDEKVALNTRIKELEEEWVRQQGEEALLSGQLKRLQDDLRRVNTQLEQGQKEKASLDEKIDDINLHIDTTQRELRRVVAAKEDQMVDENIVKLEVKRLRDTLFSHAGEVHSLEWRKLELQTAMTERNREVGQHKAMLRAQCKALEAERQATSSEVHERISKIDKLRKRYEIITVAMMPPEGEEEHSQAYYVIKAAQEREELQRKGDDYDSKIRKAEKEIRAMENTIQVMNGKNERFRQSLKRADASSEEAGKVETLEGQWRAALNKQRHKKKQVQQLQEDMQAMQRRLGSLESERTGLETRLDERQAAMTSLQKELTDLKAKRERLNKQMAKVMRELRAKKGSAASEIEQDVAVRELQEFGQSMVQRVGNLVTKHPELQPTLQLLFSQASLPPPPSPGSSRSSSTSNIGSRGGSSRGFAASSTPLATKSIELDATVLATSGSPTPGAGMSPRGSVTGSRASSKASSRASSLASSRVSSRASSAASTARRPK